MRRVRLALGIALPLLGFVATEAMAAPVDPATACASLYQAEASTMATANNTIYPFQWVRVSITTTAMSLNLQIFWPTGVRTYTGWNCTIGANGKITASHG